MRWSRHCDVALRTHYSRLSLYYVAVTTVLSCAHLTGETLESSLGAVPTTQTRGPGVDLCLGNRAGAGLKEVSQTGGSVVLVSTQNAGNAFSDRNCTNAQQRVFARMYSSLGGIR